MILSDSAYSKFLNTYSFLQERLIFGLRIDLRVSDYKKIKKYLKSTCTCTTPVGDIALTSIVQYPQYVLSTLLIFGHSPASGSFKRSSYKNSVFAIHTTRPKPEDVEVLQLPL